MALEPMGIHTYIRLVADKLEETQKEQNKDEAIRLMNLLILTISEVVERMENPNGL